MEALERRNKLLEAALSAVLKTGGTLNGCPCQASHAEGHDCQEAVASEPLVARGSVRSRVSCERARCISQHEREVSRAGWTMRR